jgi:hypothetical protein
MDSIKIYTSNVQLQIMDAKHILSEAGIHFFEINKMDSAYAGILGGDIEIHVPKEDAEKALELLADLK